MLTKNIVPYHPAVVKRGHPEVIGLLSEPKYYPGLLSKKLLLSFEIIIIWKIINPPRNWLSPSSPGWA
jgi:hypothetical protein